MQHEMQHKHDISLCSEGFTVEVRGSTPLASTILSFAFLLIK